MDNLEQYINDHRDEFDREVPSDNVWKKIDCTLSKQPPQKSRLLNRKVLAAASVVLLVGLSFVAGIFSATKAANNVSSEFAETESYYQRKIDSKKRAVAVHTTDSVWMDDIKQLELVMNELKQELDQNPGSSKGEILQAMIDNYNFRLEIMDRILEKTNDKTYMNTKPSNDDSTE